MSSSIFQHLVRRDSNQISMTRAQYGLLVTFLVLVCFGFILVGSLLLIRRRRQARRDLEQSSLPVYNEKRISSASSTHSHHRRITARPSQSIHIPNEKEMLMESVSEPPSPTEPIPEIRVTFPEEVDEAGKRQSGKVCVVRVGDTGVGLEPVADQLPVYQQPESERFQSVDLEQVGGLVEKARNAAPKW